MITGLVRIFLIFGFSFGLSLKGPCWGPQIMGCPRVLRAERSERGHGQGAFWTDDP